MYVLVGTQQLVKHLLVMTDLYQRYSYATHKTHLCKRVWWCARQLTHQCGAVLVSMVVCTAADSPVRGCAGQYGQYSGVRGS